MSSMHCINFFHDKKTNNEVGEIVYTLDGTVDRNGKQAIRSQIGTWKPATILLVNQGLATLAFFGIGVNLVLFLTRVVGQSNVEAANNVSKWTGSMYLFSLVGAFLSDSYWGRYITCAIFQAIFVVGLCAMSLISYLALLKPKGCGDEHTSCGSQSNFHKALLYMSMYMVALGMGGYQPNIAVLGADQFDIHDPIEKRSKEIYFSYLILSLNIGSLFSKTIIGYVEDRGQWVSGFWLSTGSAFTGLVLFLGGTPYYRRFIPTGNPFGRFFKQDVRIAPQEDDNQGKLNSMTPAEELKCILRLIPIWLCTIFYSVVFAQMSSLFMVQGAAMNKTIGQFHVSPAFLSIFNIFSVVTFIFIYRHVINPLVTYFRKRGLSELERMGVGLILAFFAMVAAGVVEMFRLKHATEYSNNCGSSSLSILWQIPQYMIIGASEVFMGVARLEFFYGQAPAVLKCFGNALCLTSVALGNYLSSVIASVVTKISTRNGRQGWIPEDLNKGHLDWFYFLLAGLIIVDFLVYLIIASSYKYVQYEELNEGHYDVAQRKEIEV